ncbi:DeoR/GlpR family DNA-binding transcription regulator [Humibacter soli]
MLPRQRDERIVELLRRDGGASAVDLAGALSVSVATIRRDLERLAGEGRLSRVHGGAFYRDETEQPFPEVMQEDAEAKDLIAARAAAIVADGDVVFLDIGTTTMRIAHHLRGRDVTVITSSLAVLDVLRNDDAVELVLLGGTLRRNYQTLVGPLTEEALTLVRPDLAFVSCTGVRPDGSVVDDISQEATIKRAVVTSAERTALVAAGTKFPGKGSLRIARVEQLDYLITSADADDATLALCSGAGGKVIVA